MEEAITVKVISQNKSDFEEVACALKDKYKVLATSRPIFDQTTGRFHIFLSLEEL